MIIALDTNILLDILIPNEQFYERSADALQEARTRILADFLIGAHAQKQATGLLSRDRGFYRKHFPALNLYDPTEG